MKVLIRVPQLVSCSLNVNFSFFVLTLSQPFLMLYLNPFSLHAFSLYFSWIQFLWQREDVQWGGWQGAGGGHLHGRGLLPEAAAHGL